MLVFVVLSRVFSADWTQFRGPNGTGISEGTPLPDRFRPGEELWRVATPAGHSSPVVGKGRVFLTAFSGDDLLTIALDSRTGRQLWQRTIARQRKEHLDSRNSPASPSPAVDGDRIVVFFPDVGLFAYDYQGKQLWHTPLGPFDNSYGMGASPILVDGKVVLACDQSRDSFIAAFDTRTGRLIWKRARPHAVSGHSTPAIHRTPQATLILAPASFRMDAYNLETGESVWWIERLPSEMKSVPVIAGDTVFVSGYNLAENEPGRQIQLPPFSEALGKGDRNADGLLVREESPDEMTRKYFPYVDLNHDGQLDEREWSMYAAAFRAENSLQAVRMNGRGDVTPTHVIWKYQRAIPQLPSVVAYGGDVYMISDNGILTILNSATGELRKQFRLNNEPANYFASPVAGAGKMIFCSHNGTVTVLRASADYNVLSKEDLGEPVMATPAIADGKIYIRTARSLFCFGSKPRP
jgi:outer membrane protein assembly factor BamB